MKKKYLLLLITSFALAGCGSSSKINYNFLGYTMKTVNDSTITVTFYKNIGKEELDLNSGMYATTSTLALKVDTINKGEKVSRPEMDPMRVNYEFDGWHTHQTEDSPFDFNTILNSSTVIYAHWVKLQDDEFVDDESFLNKINDKNIKLLDNDNIDIDPLFIVNNERLLKEVDNIHALEPNYLRKDI